MTANHEHTPTEEEVCRMYALKAPQEQRPRREAEFYRMIAAAEQRGAIKALRDTADHIENEIEFVLPNRYKPLRFRRSYEQDGTGLTPEEWLRARADQIEGDDASSI